MTTPGPSSTALAQLSWSLLFMALVTGHFLGRIASCYDHLNFSRAFVVQFWVSRYIMGLNHTPESKVITVWICRELSCSNSSLSKYYWPESDIRVKCYDQLSFPKTFFIKFRASRYIIGLRSTSMLKVMAVWIGNPNEKLWQCEFLERFRCSI